MIFHLKAFALFILFMILTACSGPDVPEQAEHASLIRIRPSLLETRALSNRFVPGDQLCLYYPTDTLYRIARYVLNDTWQGNLHWEDVSRQNDQGYSFCALAPADAVSEDGTLSRTDGSLDLLLATYTTPEAGEPLSLVFHHYCGLLQIKLINGLDSAGLPFFTPEEFSKATVTISSVKMIRKLSPSFVAGKLPDFQTEATLPCTLTLQHPDTAVDSGFPYQIYYIPQTDTAFHPVITITLTHQGTSYHYVWQPAPSELSHLALQQGVKTQLSLTLKSSEIGFSPILVSDWTTASTDMLKETGFRTADDLIRWMQAAQSGEDKALSGWYTLLNDIDMKNSSVAWQPVGNAAHPFTGKFSGNDHTISNLEISTKNTDAGFFGHTKNAVIENVTFQDIKITNEIKTTETYYIGALAGMADTNTIIDYCFVRNGRITTQTTVNKQTNIGGICGYNRLSDISHCITNLKITGGRYIGGICGYNRGILSQCGTYGTFENNTGPAGGIIGQNYGQLNNSYSRCLIHNPKIDYQGGLIGVNWITTTFTNCYSASVIYGNNLSDPLSGKPQNGTWINCFYPAPTLSGHYKGQRVFSFTRGSTPGEITPREVYDYIENKDIWEKTDSLPVFHWASMMGLYSGIP